MTELPDLSIANASFVTRQLVVGGDLDYHDEERSARQLAELVEAGLTHIVDCRVEADDSDRVELLAPHVDYRWNGIDDAGQRVPGEWFDEAVGHVLAAMQDPDVVVLTHCHMGINRGPSLGYAVLLALGWDPVDALTAIRDARPVAYIAYAEDALHWHHDRTAVPDEQRREDLERLSTWRREHHLDLIRVIAAHRR